MHTSNSTTTTELNRDIGSNTKGLQTDVNAGYKLHCRATVDMNIANVTATPSYRYNNNTAFMNRNGAFGAKYTFGVRGSF